MAQVKRVLLIVVMCLLGLIVLAAMGMLMLGSRGMPIEVVMPTALTEGYLLLLVLAGMQSLEKPGLRWVGVAGALLALLAVGIIPLYFYWESTFRYPSGNMELEQLIGRCVGTLIMLTSCLCFSAFVYSFRMNIFGRVLQAVAAGSLAVTTVIVLSGIWVEWMMRSNPLMESTLWGSVVMSGAGVLGTFMLSKILSIKVPDAVSAVGGMVYLRCPRCLKEQEVSTGESRCAVCRLRFVIEVEEPRCPKCGYNLHALTRPLCPECGFALASEEVSREAPAV